MHNEQKNEMNMYGVGNKVRFMEKLEKKLMDMPNKHELNGKDVVVGEFKGKLNVISNSGTGKEIVFKNDDFELILHLNPQTGIIEESKCDFNEKSCLEDNMKKDGMTRMQISRNKAGLMQGVRAEYFNNNNKLIRNITFDHNEKILNVLNSEGLEYIIGDDDFKERYNQRYKQILSNSKEKSALEMTKISERMGDPTRPKEIF